MNKIIICIFTALLLSATLQAQVNIIPQPNEVISTKKGTFNLNERTLLVYQQSNLSKSARFLNSYLEQFYGIKLTEGQRKSGKPVVLALKSTADKATGAYELEVREDGIFVSAGSEEGIFYGVQSLIQLLGTTMNGKNINLPYVHVKDKPRFAYRGALLDVTRYFFPVSYVKKYIDFLAQHKMNNFHWHLTDDQGWRIEIKKYPKLTEVGSIRNGTIIGRLPGTGNTNVPHGGFYTQEEIKEVVQYAADRYINVIPEIEMPGHASAALAGYPNLGCTGGPYKVKETWGVFDDVFCAGNDETFDFLQGVIDEVITLFPGKYIHMGGDECPKTSWKKCPKCRDRMKKLGLKDEHQLQSYFVQRMEKYINTKGKSIIGWDEILEGGLAENATVMSWRGEKGGIEAANLNHDVIMTPYEYVYLDYSQTSKEDSLTMGGLVTVEKVYSYEPVPAGLPESAHKHILGAQANVWTEYISNVPKLEYMIFPRMTALSEVLWSSKEKRNWTSFQQRLKTQFERYQLWKVNYNDKF